MTARIDKKIGCVVSDIAYWLIRRLPKRARWRVHADTMGALREQMGPISCWDKGDWDFYGMLNEAIAKRCGANR